MAPTTRTNRESRNINPLTIPLPRTPSPTNAKTTKKATKQPTPPSPQLTQKNKKKPSVSILIPPLKLVEKPMDNLKHALEYTHRACSQSEEDIEKRILQMLVKKIEKILQGGNPFQTEQSI